MSTNVYEYETSKLPSTLEFYLHGHNQLPHRYLNNSGDLNVLDNENHHLMSFRSPEDISSCQINRSSDKHSPCLNLQTRTSDDNISAENSILNGDSLFSLYNDAYNSRQQQSGLDVSAYNLSCYPNNDTVYCSGNPFVLAYDSFSCFPLSTSDKSEQEDFLDPRLGGANSVFESISRSSVKKRPSTSNRKERRRTHSINAAFSALRNCIPNVPSDTKLSKIKTLRLATSYIAFLMNVLDKNDPKLAEAGFKADMSTRRSENRDEKRKREAQEILKATIRMSEKPSKGRTGWPQQVWASELK